jgi:maltose alpha-D-glucosyltransferase / alpha-amylase
MQWDKSRNAGFSSAPAKKLYLPIDPQAGRPTVAGQISDANSLLQHVRRLIALRRSTPALQADGGFKPLFAKANTLAFVYARTSGKEQLIVALNPASKPARAVFSIASTGKVETIMADGAQFTLQSRRATVRMRGVSYGVFVIRSRSVAMHGA